MFLRLVGKPGVEGLVGVLERPKLAITRGGHAAVRVRHDRGGLTAKGGDPTVVVRLVLGLQAVVRLLDRTRRDVAGDPEQLVVRLRPDRVAKLAGIEFDLGNTAVEVSLLLTLGHQPLEVSPGESLLGRGLIGRDLGL